MKWISSLAMVVLVGCSAFGISTPKGFDQQLAVAYGVHTAVVQATTTALTAGTISAADAQAVQTQERTARQLLDTARGIEQTDPKGANNDLVLATTSLQALQTYLNSRSK